MVRAIGKRTLKHQTLYYVTNKVRFEDPWSILIQKALSLAAMDVDFVVAIPPLKLDIS
jgi:hypothetical protein